MLPEQVLDDTSDPEHGLFTLDQALDGLPDGPGPLRAIITTELGVLTCALQTNVTSASGHGALGAPNSVANFVGLARGKRAFYDATMGKWVRRRFYDGLTWHRVIPQFVAQGGDPAGNGTGGPGYTIDFEITSLRNVPGALAYASTAPMSNTAGSQFYVVAEVPQPSLDRDYAVFGLCDPVSVVTALTRVPRDSNDEPLTPIHMRTIAVTRCAP
jgi:peptidyl-prolyl cis-trans isomerase A (cyclophilin A)